MERKRHFAIFTTASLPWLTGTAVNPLFRAAYLAKNGDKKVTLVVPWLSLKDQKLVYPQHVTFNLPSEQEAHVRNWLEERTGVPYDFGIRFYPAKFSTDKRSIFPVGDITEFISDEDADIAVLEEPEHLTWYHHGKRWKAKFSLVIGIVHTNYLEYVKREKNGHINAFLLKHVNNWVVSIYCHKVIRLSAATQDLPRSIICNVHGVNPKFLEIGKIKKQQQQDGGGQAFTRGAYYIGKMVWSKGYKELLQLLHQHQRELTGLQVDLYGSGEDAHQVQEAASELEIAVGIHPGQDHADPLFHDYKVFLNPSTSDVVCTTTAEALAMGKLVVCADHPSNSFFKQFPNCRTYKNSEGFVKAIQEAMAQEPAPLTDDQAHQFSWEAATERFLKAAGLEQVLPANSVAPSLNFGSLSLKLEKNMEEASALVHRAASGIEVTRRVFGAIPGSLRPDEEQCKELGLAFPEANLHSRKWFG